MPQKDDVRHLIDCWNKSAAGGQNMPDEGRMAHIWNKRSGSYAGNQERQRQKRTAEILAFLESCGFEPSGAKVLDIGCGPGTLSLPLSRLGARVTSLDISSGMLDRLKEAVKKESLPIDVIECSWWTADIDALGFRGAFDLVIASMTPGIKDVDTFDRMMACSKKFCYYSQFLRREEDKAYRDIRRTILGDTSVRIMNGLIFPFMYLYLSGYRPAVRINHAEWKEETSWQEAADTAMNFIQPESDFDEKTKEEIMAYYQKASVDGVYCSESDVFTGMMVWEV